MTYFLINVPPSPYTISFTFTLFTLVTLNLSSSLIFVFFYLPHSLPWCTYFTFGLFKVLPWMLSSTSSGVSSLTWNCLQSSVHLYQWIRPRHWFMAYESDSRIYMTIKREIGRTLFWNLEKYLALAHICWLLLNSVRIFWVRMATKPDLVLFVIRLSGGQPWVCFESPVMRCVKLKTSQPGRQAARPSAPAMCKAAA